MKNLTWQNPEQLFVAQELINKVKSKCCGIKVKYIAECNGENNLSEADCSVLLLAKRLECRLLTSDQKLKRKAEEHGVEVNGFLWLTDLLVEEQIVTEKTMVKHLNRYLETNPRAPENEVVKRIDFYNKKIIMNNKL